jgi:ankyrin repeat protein
LYNNSIQHSITRYLKENLSPYQQFVRDLSENYEAATFNKITNEGEHQKFKTMRTPKNDTMAKIIGGIKNEENLANFINHFFLEEGNRFLDIFDKEMSVNDKAQVKNAIEQICSLSEEEAKKYALGILIHVSSIDQTESKNLVDLIKLTKDKGINVNDNLNGINPLEFAVIKGANSNVKILLEQGANPNLINESHKLAPLHWAYAAEQYNVLETLIKHNANVNIPYPNGKTLLSYSVQEQNNKAIKVLLKDNNLKVDMDSANFILKQTTREYFKGTGLPKEAISRIVTIINDTTKQLAKDNPSINFYPLVQGEGYEKFLGAMVSAVADNKKQELIDLSTNIIQKAELQKQSEDIGKYAKRSVTAKASYYNNTSNVNNANKEKSSRRKS